MTSFGSKEKCTVCDKTVYPMEKVSVEGAKGSKVLHSKCFRCCQCNKIVNLTNYGALEEKIYCKSHYAAELKSSKNSAPKTVHTKKEASSETKSKKTETKNEETEDLEELDE
jgi:cysteine and glycine-rich protein